MDDANRQARTSPINTAELNQRTAESDIMTAELDLWASVDTNGDDANFSPSILRGIDDNVAESTTHQELVQSIIEGGANFVNEMFNAINPEQRTFNTVMQHQSRNLVPSCLLYDSTRVKVQEENEESQRYARQTDFYHASHVDSYWRKNGYILAQAPFDILTEASFWMMCYQQRPVLIVLLGALVSRSGKRTMKNFWPMPGFDQTYDVNKLMIKCSAQGVMMGKHCDEYTISLTKNFALPGEAVDFTLLHYREWRDDFTLPDYSTETKGIFELREIIKRKIRRILSTRSIGGEDLGPLLMTCPTGVNRCGAFATIDIVLDRIADKDQVGLDETIRVLREQRHGCVPNSDQYHAIRKLIYEYIRRAISNPSEISEITESLRSSSLESLDL